ncbi:hypothetical protein [Neobacillus sp. D3-1R]|uniref:hypothetical protein n=1 Tax=Neobacillus sp. D3-1R TaxID=3445778 RepID=UPI003FA1903C
MRILSITVLTIFLSGCSPLIEHSYSTHNPTAIEVLKENPKADIFQYEGLIYSNASQLDWVQEKEFKKGELLGKIINRTHNGRLFTDGVSSQLPVGTKIYQTSSKGVGFLIVENNGQEIVYLALIEG